MKPYRSFSLSQRLLSFRHALSGIRTLIQHEHNARVHLGAALIVALAAWASEISAKEWMILVLAIALVWVAEALNTAVELVCDVVTTDQHPLIKKAKDIAAGAVLIASVAAMVIGFCIFLPHWTG